MGCADSQLSEKASSQAPPPPKKKPRFVPTYDDLPGQQPDIPYEEEIPPSPKKKHKSLGKSMHAQNTPQPQKKTKQANKENTLKVRKAKQLKNKESHEKFISQIVANAKSQLKTEHPDIPTANPSQFAKPVVEYSPQRKKGAILPEESQLQVVNRWERPITETVAPSPSLSLNKSYVGVNESSKTSFRQRQIEQRLESIRNGRFQESQSGQIVRLREPDPDSAHTIQL